MGGRRPCSRSRITAAASSTAAQRSSPTCAGQSPSRRGDPWLALGSRWPRGLVHPPVPAGNTPDGLLQATPSARAAARVACSGYQALKLFVRVQEPSYRPDILQSLGSGRIERRLWRSWVRSMRKSLQAFRPGNLRAKSLEFLQN